MEKWIKAKDLAKKHNFEFSRLWRWAQKGWVKSKWVNENLEWETGWKGRWKVKTKKKILYIDEVSFLAVPTFIRERTWKRKLNDNDIKKIKSL